MYEIVCADCGRVGFHPSRVAAESRAETHINNTGHMTDVVEMQEV